MIVRQGMIGTIATAVVLLATTSAFAGKKEDILELQSRMSQIERTVDAGATTTVRISELEAQIQALTGRVEELTFELDQANARLNSMGAVLAGDPALGASLGSVGGPQPFGGPQPLGPQPLGPSTPGAVVPGDDPIAEQITRESAGGAAGLSSAASDTVNNDVELPLDPDAAFEYASGFLLQGDYQRARSAFMLYGDAFPNHPRTADAMFRLGEIHLALGENAEAADLFIAHIRAYPNDIRAAEAYLKLGTAFSRLEKPTEACKVFKSLKSKFPNAPVPVVDRANSEMTQINCQ